MAQFVLEIADADVAKVLEAMAGMYGRPETVPNPDFNNELPEGEGNPRDIDNPESYGQFAHRKVREFLAENVIAWEVKKAQVAVDAARAAASVTITDPNV